MKLIKRNKRVKWVLFVSLCFIVVGSIFILLPGPEKHRPNIVIILIDALRDDHSSLYGYGRKTTPHLERIAKTGLTLKNHFVNSPWTKPSVASMITGLYPTQHGSRVGQLEDLEDFILGTPKIEILNSKLNTLAEILKESGYSTHAFITNYHMTPKFGYDQGYDHYSFNPNGAKLDVVCQADRESIKKAMLALENKKEKPVFIWCHLMAVHGYRFPSKFNKFHPEKSTPVPENAFQTKKVRMYKSIEEAVCSYDNSILYLDSLVGEFYDFIKKRAPDTILIVTSDHGEEFYEHGGFEHSRTLYNEILRAPCVIHGPGVPSGRFNELSDSLDLMPTILKNVGIKINSDLKGNILYSNSQISQKGKSEIFAEQHHRGLAKRFVLIKGSKKMILNQHKESGEINIEFYDNGLVIEGKNVFPRTNPSVIEGFKRKIYLYMHQTQTYFKKRVGRPSYKNLSKEDIKHLRSLGYIE